MSFHLIRIPHKRKLILTFLLPFVIVPAISSLHDSLFNSDPILERKLSLASTKLSFQDEYKLFEEELEQGIAKHSGGKSRQKRYVYLNTESNVEVGFLIVIPVTVVLPAMTNLFNNWRRKRSIANFNGNNATTDGNPFQQRQANKISSYFDLVNIPEVSCQLRAICDFSADPNSYFPLSDIVLSKLKDFPGVDSYEVGRANSTSSGSLFDQYFKAADDGITFGSEKCHEIYSGGCKYPTEKLLNMPVMKFWRKVQSSLRLKFEDITEH